MSKRKPTRCPICKGDGSLTWGKPDDDVLRDEPCPLCLGSGDGRGAAETARYLRKCEARLAGNDWPGPGMTRDAMTGEIIL